MSNYIDTRELYKRKCELEELKETLETAQEELTKAQANLDRLLSTGGGDETDGNAQEEAISEAEEAVEDAQVSVDSAEIDFGDEEALELAELEELESEVSGFMHGETMIPVDQFEDYARDFADDIGAIDKNASWPCSCIDWEQAARELAMDYSEVTYQGESYYVRS